MKAHITGAALPLAILYGAPMGAEAVLGEAGIACRVIFATDLNKTVGALTDNHNTAAAPFAGEAPSASLLLMHNFPRELLNKTLDSLREESVAIDYKAIVTTHNKAWTVLALLEELAHEKAAIEGGNKT